MGTVWSGMHPVERSGGPFLPDSLAGNTGQIRRLKANAEIRLEHLAPSP